MFHMEYSRLDVKGGGLLQGLDKYYPSDLGIKNMLLGFPRGDYGFALENAVCNELKLRGYELRVGKTDSLEIDFVAEKANEKLYVQVSASVLDAETRKRELAPLRGLARGGARSLLLAYDRMGLGFEDGVEVTNVVDWLLEEQ